MQEKLNKLRTPSQAFSVDWWDPCYSSFYFAVLYLYFACLCSVFFAEQLLNSPRVFSGDRVTRCFVDRCLSFRPFSFGRCVVCSSSIYRFWLPRCFLQSIHVCVPRLSNRDCLWCPRLRWYIILSYFMMRTPIINTLLFSIAFNISDKFCLTFVWLNN